MLHATWNALVKSGGDRLAVLTVVMGSQSLFALPILFFVTPPPAEAWPWLLASVAIHAVYFCTLVFAYRHGDLSQVYPIARGSAPLLVAVGAWALAGESMSPAEAAGVGILSAGIISLAWRRGARPPEEWRSIGFALATACMIGCYSLSDGMGVRASGDPLGYIPWLFFLSPLPLLILFSWRRRGRLAESIKPHWRRGLIGGAVSAAAYSIVIWAMSQGPMAHIVALRETSVIMAAVIGSLALKEPFGARRITASAVVAAGAVLLNAGL